MGGTSEAFFPVIIWSDYHTFFFSFDIYQSGNRHQKRPSRHVRGAAHAWPYRPVEAANVASTHRAPLLATAVSCVLGRDFHVILWFCVLWYRSAVCSEQKWHRTAPHRRSSPDSSSRSLADFGSVDRSSSPTLRPPMPSTGIEYTTESERKLVEQCLPVADLLEIIFDERHTRPKPGARDQSTYISIHHGSVYIPHHCIHSPLFK